MAADKAPGEGNTPDPIKKLKDEAASLRKDAENTLEYAKKLGEENERRSAELQFREQQLTPMTIHQVRIHGATNTRQGFLNPLFAPLVSDAANANSTLGSVTQRLQEATTKLDRLGIFHPSPHIFLNSSEQTDPSTSPTDVDVDIAVRELPRYKFNAGTDVGNSEGSAYTSLLWNNIFGGAERLSLNASAGTRTRSAYSADLSAPISADSDGRVSLEVLSSATDKPWASHEEVLHGGALKYSWLSSPRDMHSVEYAGSWRQITSLSGGASPTVRFDAGDSVKSALRHVYRRETRDNPQLPQSGYHIRSLFELAGVGPLGGDVSFSKSEFELGGAVPLPLPGIRAASTGISIGAGLKMGMLYPLAPGFASLKGEGKAQPSRINDRFQLGGPTDVRGFKLGGLGPHDGADAVGGDVFAAGSVNMLFPLPYKGPDSALRFQVFANGGRSVALKNTSKGSSTADQGMDAGTVASGMATAISDLVRGPPSIAAGVGLVYAHPVARFELNFSLPLVLRRGEVGTKGLQVGVGINFL